MSLETQCYILQLVSGPTIEPVTLEQAKIQVHRFDNEEDLRLKRLIKSAREFAETYLSVSLAATTWNLTLNAFPTTEIVFPYPPLVSITEVAYTDTDEAAQVLAADQYVVDTIANPGRMIPAIDVTWPEVSENAPNPIQITYVAGYAAPANVPQAIKEAILLHVEYHYGNSAIKPETWLNLLQTASSGLNLV